MELKSKMNKGSKDVRNSWQEERTEALHMKAETQSYSPGEAKEIR